jgi:hypothetical protein
LTSASPEYKCQPGHTDIGPGWPIRCLQYPFVAGRFEAVHHAHSQRGFAALRHAGVKWLCARTIPRRVAASNIVERSAGMVRRPLQRSCVGKLANSALIAGCASPAIPNGNSPIARGASLPPASVSKRKDQKSFDTEFSGKRFALTVFLNQWGYAQDLASSRANVAPDRTEKSGFPRSDIGSKGVVGCPSRYSCGDGVRITGLFGIGPRPPSLARNVRMVVSELSDQRTTLPPLPRSVAEVWWSRRRSRLRRWRVDDPPVGRRS